MKLNLTLVAIFALSVPVWGDSQKPDEFDAMKHDPPMVPHYAKGAAHGSSPNLTYRGGEIMPTAATMAIFWGTTWSSCTLPGCDKITGIDSWYTGVTGSSYAKTSDEYTGVGGQITSSISYGGHLMDPSAAPSKAPTTSAILNEVCKVLADGKIAPVTNGYYAVYVDAKRGHAGYCAWHSWSKCGTTPIQFAFFFNLDNDSGCDPGDALSGHSQGLAAIANVTGHELSEARTDPRGDGWLDQSGEENGDKCAWTFGTSLLTFTNNTQWKIQGNWSNTAYTGNFGYLNSSGQKGCLDGGNYPAVAP